MDILCWQIWMCWNRFFNETVASLCGPHLYFHRFASVCPYGLYIPRMTCHFVKLEEWGTKIKLLKGLLWFYNSFDQFNVHQKVCFAHALYARHCGKQVMHGSEVKLPFQNVRSSWVTGLHICGVLHRYQRDFQFVVSVRSADQECCSIIWKKSRSSRTAPETAHGLHHLTVGRPLLGSCVRISKTNPRFIRS